MKKSIFSKVGAAAMVLTLVTASLVGGTFAKYTSTVSGTASATVAQWKVDLTDGTSTLKKETPIPLKNENTKAGMAEGVVGPESFGTFKIVVDGTGTQVDYNYKIVFDTTNITAPIKFYEGTDNQGTLITPDGIKNATAIKADDANKKKEINIYWEWDTDSTPDADTDLGKKADGTAEIIDIIMTAEQDITTP